MLSVGPELHFRPIYGGVIFRFYFGYFSAIKIAKIKTEYDPSINRPKMKLWTHRYHICSKIENKLIPSLPFLLERVFRLNSQNAAKKF